ncbi:type II secretion system F family protein [Candidatus Mycobacterium methanotrophicum]|uniref:Type II secretion system F family protein n=1 Tax=Candidatus Mycobacterium methanotrophicum TaxID=2943498 RepID=A0ABY4QLX5_9MYCO|nr:type II secretion system F family protein [Candidatus Mycobacterium methanotrophicum]UQX11242.1 type II secretion system F family protein [Candidatus Mycobacterium methanotrophicum]
MTAPVAALALSAAVLVSPGSPRRRLARPDRGRTWLPPRVIGWCAVCAAAGGAVLLPPTTVLATAALAATAGLRYRRRRRGRRGMDEARQLETAIDVLVGELRVGAHPAQAFAVAANETAGPVAESCRAVAARARLGADVTAGLRSVAQTSALPAHWDRLAVCWELASEHGLAMSALMRAAQRDIVERHRFSGHVMSAMAGARATAAILAGLPMLTVLFGQVVGADPVGFLLAGQAGGWLLVAGTVLVCGGLLWSDRITDGAAS